MAWGRRKDVTPEPIPDIDLEQLLGLVERLENAVQRLAKERKAFATQNDRAEKIARQMRR